MGPGTFWREIVNRATLEQFAEEFVPDVTLVTSSCNRLVCGPADMRTLLLAMGSLYTSLAFTSETDTRVGRPIHGNSPKHILGTTASYGRHLGQCAAHSRLTTRAPSLGSIRCSFMRRSVARRDRLNVRNNGAIFDHGGHDLRLEHTVDVGREAR